MKFQVAAALCALLLLASEAVGCDIMQLMPCVTAAKNEQVPPSAKCCDSISNMGKGILLSQCLCDLVYHPLAQELGVNADIALRIPQKCLHAVSKAQGGNSQYRGVAPMYENPYGKGREFLPEFSCHGIPVPGI